MLEKDDYIVNQPTDERLPLLLRMVLLESEWVGPGTHCRYRIESTNMEESYEIINETIDLTKSKIRHYAYILPKYPTRGRNFFTVDIRGRGHDGRCRWCNYLKIALIGKCNALSMSMKLEGKCKYGYVGQSP